jgi:hypothetical protein
MKPARSILAFTVRTTLGLLTLASLGMAQGVVEDYYDDVVIDDGQPAQVNPYIAEIERATEPSVAVEAYTRARANAPDSLLLEQVYVHRLAELGAPDLCQAEARDLVSRGVNDGLAWAVLAFNNAEGEDFAAALTEIANGVRYARDDEFVQRVAGQLLAWYDTGGARAELPVSVRQAVHDIRSALAGQSAYAAAYREARGFYDSQQGGGVPSAAPVVPQPVYVPPVAYEPIYRERYVDTYIAPYDYSYPGYVYPGWTGGIYVGSRHGHGSRAIVVPFTDRHGDRHYYRPDGGDHRRDGWRDNRDDHRRDGYRDDRDDRRGDHRSDRVTPPVRRQHSDSPGNRDNRVDRTPNRRSTPTLGDRAPSRVGGNRPSRFDAAGRPTLPLWSNGPGAKPADAPTPGLKPPVTPGVKPVPAPAPAPRRGGAKR